MGEGSRGFGCCVGGRRDRETYVAGKPDDCVGDPFGRRLLDVNTVAPIVVHGWTEVPALNGMWRPSAADGRLLMDHDAGADRSERRAVKVERSMELSVCGQAGIDAGRAKEIEREQCLRQELVPEVKWKVRVGAAKAGNEMIFERADCTFSGVAAMDVWWGKLVIDGLLRQELLEGLGCLVVKSLEAWLEATTCKELDTTLVAGENVSTGSGT